MDLETKLRNAIEKDMDATIKDSPIHLKSAARKAKDKWIKMGRPVNQKTLEAYRKGIENESTTV
jgi:hypothetical protein